MKRKSRTRTLKKALKQPSNYTVEEYQNMISQLYGSMLNDELSQQYRKRKGFGYVERKTDFSDPRGGEDDGVRGEGEQSPEPGES